MKQTLPNNAPKYKSQEGEKPLGRNFVSQKYYETKRCPSSYEKVSEF